MRIEDLQLGGQGVEVFVGEVQAAGEHLDVFGADRLFGADPVDLAQAAARLGGGRRDQRPSLMSSRPVVFRSRRPPMCSSCLSGSSSRSSTVRCSACSVALTTPAGLLSMK